VNFFDRLFKRKSKASISPMPSWKTVIEMMYDQNLDTFADEVTEVIYSTNRSMRYVILKDEKGFFTYQLEAIYQYDADEWKYIYSYEDALPAMWKPLRQIEGKSVFNNIEELKKELKAEPEYKRYFC
jgi:hypothetical protein